ncbi:MULTISPECIES: T9SS type A sorting domain-containing protein [unclassified Lentimicrobium]|uniref:T9SS type A sorting domain-containing protein n=1 Tax=unclassified Lentimicrobium TaxID=2677434 RepID=UPI001557EE37|nr:MULTISPECIES: T9SS type A sorting domain-containing protein [unclassified Lentimicrobium]NPD46501.1 T9SS type A sorting domain-containing protein [Lentimicrobium sp. S6]NPD86007.1 T9SS type A sorting domain-containing protein [Lentimicrobium sp. L6]
MKKIYFTHLRMLLLSMAFFIIGDSYAQPAFTSSDMPNIGDSDSIIFIPESNFQHDLELETGPDYTWDFSYLPFESYASFVNVDSYREKQHDMAEYFPDAAFERHTNGVSGELLGYYDFQNDTLMMYRYRPPSASGWFPPIALMAFPLEYGETSDITSTFYYGDLATGERRAQVKYDGFGTLKMPDNKTHNNVFRVKRVEKDTTFVTQSSITYISYLWYKQGGEIPLLEVKYNGSPNNYIIFGSKANGSQTGLQELVELKGLSLYPNPAQSYIKLDLQNPEKVLELNLLNSLGQTIQSFEQLPESIVVQDLLPGYYYIQVKSKNEIAGEIFVKK